MTLRFQRLKFPSTSAKTFQIVKIHVKNKRGFKNFAKSSNKQFRKILYSLVFEKFSNLDFMQSMLQ